MTEPLPKPNPSSCARLLLWFLLANVVCGFFVFRGGMCGQALLAPLDILPAVCSKYKFLDPNSSGVPANHFIIDQVTYDLPEQSSIWRAYRSGEIPWWDAYNWAGRPLLAEAHINGTEPIRVLCYLTLPFDKAYNWARILNTLFGGFTLLLLLRHWRFSDSVCVLLALAYEFAGGFVLYFSHPWIQSSFNYYPLMWLAWDAWFQQRRWWSLPLGAVAVAGAFNAGNLQSHAYVVLFASAILAGYGGLSWPRWKTILPIVALSGVLGAALAAPVLFNEIEMYRFSTRLGELHTNASPLGGLLSLFAVYPWATGTFRTLDVGKIFNCTNMGFHLFIGSPAVLLAVLGACKKPASDVAATVRRAALWLVVVYFLIICTPLEGMLYTRSAGLGVLGLVTLAALGLNILFQTTVPVRRWGQITLVLVALLVIGTNVASLLIYPKYLPKVREMVYAKNEKSLTGYGNAHALRDFQIDNFANEVSFKNPETVLASLGLLAFAALCLAPAARRPAALTGLLVLNLLPVLLFSHRYIPVHPIAMWQKLTADDTEQHRVAQVLSPGSLRLVEFAPNVLDRLYPNALSHLFQVRGIFGYSSLQPPSFMQLSSEELHQWLSQAADYIYESGPAGEPGGELRKNTIPGLARFQWIDAVDRGVRVEQESMNEIRLAIGSGPEAELLRADTWYPGWSAWAGETKLDLQRTAPFFYKIKVPAGEQTVVLRYEPVNLRLGLTLACASIGILALASVVLARSKKVAQRCSVEPAARKIGA